MQKFIKNTNVKLFKLTKINKNFNETKEELTIF
jgi:hypothetical protein